MATETELTELLAAANGTAPALTFPPGTNPKHVAAAVEAQKLALARTPEMLADRLAAVKAGQPDPLDVKLAALSKPPA